VSEICTMSCRRMSCPIIGWLMNGGFWKVAVITLPRNYPGFSHENPSLGRPVSRPRFEPGTPVHPEASYPTLF
jgi:hypothetical protein